MTKPVLHEAAREAAERFSEAVHAAVGDPVSIVAYGSAVRADFDPVRSDLDVLVALEDASLDPTLAALAAPIAEAWREHRVEPYLVRAAELPRLADVFPMRLLDIQRAHVVLRGDDPLAGIEVAPEHLRLRVEQELRNRLLRTRRRVVAEIGSPIALAQLLRRTARALRLELWALLAVVDGEPEALETRAVFRAAADRLDLDRATLDGLADLAEGVEPADARRLAGGLLGLLERAVAIADRAEAG